MQLENQWEVEMAAMLAHIGAVTLPAVTAEKYYAGQPLTPGESAMVERMPLSARRLLAKIPRLEGVIAILDAFNDPAAVPADLTPIGADILRIAFDYEQLDSSGVTDTVALGALRGRGSYDPRLLDQFGQAVGVGRRTPTVRELPLAGLRTGMVLADDLRSLTGGLLVARGHTVTDQLLDRLDNLRAGVREPVRVIDSDPADLV